MSALMSVVYISYLLVRPQQYLLVRPHQKLILSLVCIYISWHESSMLAGTSAAMLVGKCWKNFSVPFRCLRRSLALRKFFPFYVLPEEGGERERGGERGREIERGGKRGKEKKSCCVFVVRARKVKSYVMHTPFLAGRLIVLAWLIVLACALVRVCRLIVLDSIVLTST